MTQTREFEAFVRAYQDMVFTTALRLVGSEADAEDIAQEVFLKAYGRYDELAENPRAGGWLKTVSRNLSLNHLTRYRARWRFFSEMSSDREGEGSPLEWAAPDTHDQVIDAQDRRNLLEFALQKLPVAQRVPLVLYHFEDLGYEEIAHKLGVSLSKVKTDIHRGRENLRRRLRLGDVGDELEGLCGAESPCYS